MPTCRLCKDQFSNRMEIDGKVRNLTGRQYCLKCSPFKLHNTKKLEVVSQNLKEKKCGRCKHVKAVDQFYRKLTSKNGYSSYCKDCNTAECAARQKKFKQQCVDYKGGKCEKCGYNAHFAALDFHHIEPKLKDFSISQRKSYAFTDEIKNELDKCQLVCANCHREIHQNLLQL